MCYVGRTGSYSYSIGIASLVIKQKIIQNKLSILLLIPKSLTVSYYHEREEESLEGLLPV